MCSLFVVSTPGYVGNWIILLLISVRYYFTCYLYLIFIFSSLLFPRNTANVYLPVVFFLVLFSNGLIKKYSKLANNNDKDNNTNIIMTVVKINKGVIKMIITMMITKIALITRILLIKIMITKIIYPKSWY